MEPRRKPRGQNSPTGHTGINMNAPVTGWAAWFVQPDTADLPPAAELVLENCRARGLAAELLQLPEPADGDIEGRMNDGKALVVVARKLPPSAMASRVVLIGPAGATSWAAVVDPAGSAQDCALRVLSALEKTGLLPADSEEAYTPEEEERLRKALDDLGYL